MDDVLSMVGWVQCGGGGGGWWGRGAGVDSVSSLGCQEARLPSGLRLADWPTDGPRVSYPWPQVLGRECHNKQLPMLPAVLIDAASAVCPF